MKGNAARLKKWPLCLLLAYLGAVLVRYVAALCVTSFPTVGIDEFLYYSLARSIATEGKLMFRGQSANYAFPLYPLALSPVYLVFGEKAPFYRLLQLWNTALMSASVFPVYALGKRMFGSEKKAFAAALLCLLLPDFILGEHFFSEAILFPLFFTLMYCAYAWILDGRPGLLLWGGLLGGLLYSAKPGAVVPACVFLLTALIRSIAGRRKKDILACAGAAAILAATAGLFWLTAGTLLGYEGGQLSIYQAQLRGPGDLRWDSLLKAFLGYLFYFILSCGIVGFLYPAASAGRWKADKAVFWRYVLASLLVTMLGAAWVVEPSTALNNVHMRYVAMYVPLMLLFCGVTEEKEADRTAARRLFSVPRMAAVLGYAALFCVVLGCKAKAQTTDVHALLSVSWLNDSYLPADLRALGDALIILLCAVSFLLFLRARRRDRVSQVCMLVMAVCMLVNGLLGYALERQNYHPSLEADGLAVRDLTDGRPYVYLLSDEGVVDMGVDVNMKQNNCVVYTNDFVNALQRSGGVYAPFAPERMRGMSATEPTPDVDTLVIDYDSYRFLTLSEYTTTDLPNGHATAYVVRFTPGERLVDSTLSNLNGRTLPPGKAGILLVFREDLLNRPLKIRLEIESGVAQPLTIHSTHELYTVELSPGTAWYEVTFNKAEDAFNFQIQDAPIRLSGYELVSET